MNDAVHIRDLTVIFDHPVFPVTALDRFSMTARCGEIVGVIGPSGSGKTTLLSVLGGMLPADDGVVLVDGTDVLGLGARELEDYRRSMIGIVFQGFNLLPGLTAAENVALPLLVAGVRPSMALEHAEDLLGQLGLRDRSHHRPHELSGGQKQRVAVSRALINEPVVLLADEPTANLDRESAESVVKLLHSLRDSGRTVLVSTHDDRLAADLDQTIVLGGAHVFGLTDGVIELDPGEVLYSAGSDATCGFELQDGEIEVLVPESSDVFAVLSPGDRFGHVEFELGCPRGATMRARTSVIVEPCGRPALEVVG